MNISHLLQNLMICKGHYDLNSVCVMTFPVPKWQAPLKMKQQFLEFLTDIDIHLFIESGIIGVVSMIKQRFLEANNKTFRDDKTKEAS